MHIHLDIEPISQGVLSTVPVLNSSSLFVSSIIATLPYFFLLSFHMYSNIMLNSSEISYDMSLICTNIPNCSWTMQRLCFLKSIKLIKMKVVFLVFCVNGKYKLLRKLTTCEYVCSGLLITVKHNKEKDQKKWNTLVITGKKKIQQELPEKSF